MTFDRRVFLKQMGAVLATLGLSEVGLSSLGDRYTQVLAQPTRRKLALLVGINDYPESVSGYAPIGKTALSGCVTDVELQRELLISRFGFAASDIVTLTDQQATRQRISQAFAEHLQAQAKPGDVVMFHFSGLGSRVDSGMGVLSNSLVPIDGRSPTADDPAVSDLLEEQLGLWLRTLGTEQILLMLDAGYANLGYVLQGNLQVRSRPNGITGITNLTGEREETWEQIRSQWRSGKMPGTLIAGAATDQPVMEFQWNGFCAGLLTYALTQQLWWNTAPLRVSFNGAISTMRQGTGMGQSPLLNGQNLQNPIGLVATGSADGVITAVEDDKVQVALGGLPAAVLSHYGASILRVDGQDSSAAQIQIRSREGHYAKASLLNGTSLSLKVGQLLQEQIRVLPRNLGLTIALDKSLDRIERVDATSALSAISRTASVAAGEAADFLWGKQDQSYGLFYPAKTAIANSLQPEAAIKKSISRIKPQLRSLLAIKLLRLTENPGTSRLGIRATLELMKPQEKIVRQQETVRVPRAKSLTPLPATPILANDALPVGGQIRYQMLNFGDAPLYYMVLGLDSSGEAIGLNLTAETSVIFPNQPLTVPDINMDWKVQAPAGLVETFLIFSTAPLTQTYEALSRGVALPANRRITRVENLLEVVETLLQELQGDTEAPPDTYGLDVERWATLGFVYPVVYPVL
jgi:hypothetical protein